MNELCKQLLDALEAMHLEFGSSFPDNERTAVDMAREAMKAAQKEVMEKCEWCGHSLDDNSHGVDQSDFSGTEYLGACKYCNQCYRHHL